MKRILINKSKGQIRVALIHEELLYDIEIEEVGQEQKIDRICNGEVVSIEPSLEAAFINFGSDRNGFLSLKEIAPEYYSSKKRNRTDQERIGIKDVLFEGQKILVQVNKEERGSKGAALSSFISLAGCYLVLMPNNPKAGGISRRIEGDERDELRAILDGLTIPPNMGVIVRTAGMGRSLEELQWDLDVLVNLWNSIKKLSQANGAPYFIHQDSDISIRAIRDHLRPDIHEILIDDKEEYEKVISYVERVKPDYLDRVKLYEETVPLFGRFQVENQIETAFQRKVRLPSGGEIVIDRSEALTSIDVNSAQSTRGGHIEETALNTNLEATKEIARQLRIRDLGGLFIIDFIDMERDGNNRKVEDYLREVLRMDRARIQFSRISRFGLLEMSRQRLRPALSEASQVICPRCHGQGSIRNVKSLAVTLCNLIEEKAIKGKVKQIRVQVPVDVSTYMFNEQRQTIARIEHLHNTEILILPNPYLQTPQYELETNDFSRKERNHRKQISSYEMLTPPDVKYEVEGKSKRSAEKQGPALKSVLPDTPAPTTTPARKKEKRKSLWVRALHYIFGGSKKKEEPKKEQKRRPSPKKHHHKKNQYNNQQSNRQQSRGGYRRSRRNYRTKDSSDTSSQSKPSNSRRKYSDHKHPAKENESIHAQSNLEKEIMEEIGKIGQKNQAISPASDKPKEHVSSVETKKSTHTTHRGKKKEPIAERKQYKKKERTIDTENLIMVETKSIDTHIDHTETDRK